MENIGIQTRRNRYNLSTILKIIIYKNIFDYYINLISILYCSKRGYPVEPDRERFVDTKGRSICCYYCKLPPRHLRPIMSCDFCDQHWHFDCLTPPLTIAPPLHKKWMCPLHADHVLVGKKIYLSILIY